MAVGPTPVAPLLCYGPTTMTAGPPVTLKARLDHIAVAVGDWAMAETRWRDQLGGRTVGWARTPSFWTKQLRFADGGKLELLMPPPDVPDSFAGRFLRRFGSAVHHVTLKVPDVLEAADLLRDAGFDVVDVNVRSEHWQEAFLRPSQVGGLVVQLGWSPYDDDAYAALLGFTPETVPPDAAAFRGVTLAHPDRAEAADTWALLGADVRVVDGAVRCTWPDSPLSVTVVDGPTPTALGLRFDGAGGLPAVDGLGPAVLCDPDPPHRRAPSAASN
jgi:catechol 2,3-dioxygenase-like lactoylglutathione lyase family enzyme